MAERKRVAVIGCGRWGSLIAWYLDRLGHGVCLYGRESSAAFVRFKEEGRNDFLTLPKTVALTSSLSEVMERDIVIISVGSQQLRGLMEELAVYPAGNRVFVLCM